MAEGTGGNLVVNFALERKCLVCRLSFAFVLCWDAGWSFSVMVRVNVGLPRSLASWLASGM